MTLRLLPRKIFPTNLFIHFYFCFVSVFKIQLRIPNSIHSTQTISCIGRSREISQGILVFRKILSRNLVRPSTKSFSFYNAGLDHPNGHPLSNTNIYLCHLSLLQKLKNCNVIEATCCNTSFTHLFTHCNVLPWFTQTKIRSSKYTVTWKMNT